MYSRTSKKHNDMANKDLVVKLTINSQDFDNGLRNAKSSMNKFQKDTLSASSIFKSAIGGMTKAFGALGIAVGGAQMFKTFIKSTQTMGDKWDNTMIAAKTSFQTFATAVMSGNNDLIRNFRSLISAANEFAEAQDALGSAKISNRYARLNYLNPLNQALANAGEPGISKEQKQAYINEAKGYYQQYANNVNVVKAAAQREVIAWLNKELPGYSFNESNMKPTLDNLYLNLINGVLDPVTKRYKEVTGKDFWKGNALVNSQADRISSGEALMLGEGYSRQQIAMARLISKQLEIPDNRLNENLDVLETEVNATAELIQLQRRINRAMGSGGSGTMPKLTGGGASTSSTPTMTPDQVARYWFNAQTPGALVDIPIPEEEIFEPETEELMNSVAEQMKLIQDRTKYAAAAMSSFGQAFGYAADIAGDNPFGNTLQALSGVTNAAVSTASAMMALTGAETMEGVAESFSSAPPFMKLAVAGTALAGILSMMAAVKSSFAGSFASGGIVGGNSYTGDNLWARVNTGEMIIPYNDWHNANAGSNVRFVIEGSQLKGVLDNYDKTVSL